MTAPDQCCINVKKLLSIRRRPHMTAGSTGRRNTGVKFLCRGFKSQGLAWPLIELAGHTPACQLQPPSKPPVKPLRLKSPVMGRPAPPEVLTTAVRLLVPQLAPATPPA